MVYSVTLLYAALFSVRHDLELFHRGDWVTHHTYVLLSKWGELPRSMPSRG
jgi:hypothetical protein